MIKMALRTFRKLRGIVTGTTPTLKTSKHHYRLCRLGSAYGGWTVVDSEELHDSLIISCGLGEDASFDVEFASKFNSHVVLLDPTPRAILHYAEIMRNLGNPATVAYSDGGKQPIEAYDLSSVRPDTLKLIEKAIWNENTTLKFFSPANPSHVSHSLVNYENGDQDSGAFIKVETTTIDYLLECLGITDIPLIKLDIEGAEIEVLSDLLEKKILPKQLLIEFDAPSVPSKTSKARIESAHGALLRQGYQLIHHDDPNNFLYVLSPGEAKWLGDARGDWPKSTS